MRRVHERRLARDRARQVARRDLLVELGTEELPPKALHTLELALPRACDRG